MALSGSTGGEYQWPQRRFCWDYTWPATTVTCGASFGLFGTVDSNCAAEDNTAVERSGIEAIGSVLTGEYPSLQAVYLFGSAAEAEPGEALDGAGDIDKS